MPDLRFFEDLGPVTLEDLAALTGARLCDRALSGRTVRAVANLGGATPDSITFAADQRYLPQLRATEAGACFVLERDLEAVPAGCAALVTASPQAAYAVAAGRLHRPRSAKGGEWIAADVHLEADVELGPGVVLGEGCRIGAGSRIGANSVIGPGVAIGRGCEISANVTIGFALIGDRVRILAGAAIGEPGFGATAGAGGLIEIPQLGRVILQDGVSIGANSCVDRGAFEDTVVGENTKIDNQVQIAHNVRIGRNCAIAAQSGISGSVVVGDGVQFGGRAGIADHMTIGAGARVGAAAGVLKDIPPGETWSGTPARPIRRWMRETAWLSRMAARKESP